MKKIIAFSGSNSPVSINQQLIQIVSKYIIENTENIEVEILNLRNYPAPMFGIEEEETVGFPQTMQDFHAIMQSADGFVVSSPEHNGSMPAVLKNTIDWLSRIGGKVFNDKPTVFLSTSPGARGGASVLQHLMGTMPYRGANVIGGHGVGSFNEKIINDEVVPGDDKLKLQELMKELAAAL